MINCVTCNQEIANDARVCPKCGANQFKQITIIRILLSAVSSSFIAFLFSAILSYFLEDGMGGITDIIFFTMMGIIFILTIYKDYNTKKEEL